MQDSISITDLNIFIAPFHRDWTRFSSRLELTESVSHDLYTLLLAAYTEKHRAYHTVQHIVECLALLELVRDQLDDPIAIEMAIWFHDAIYDPKAADNELRSAMLMQQYVQPIWDEQRIQKIYNWIMATQQHQPSHDTDLNYLLDIDLAILGSTTERFQSYEQQIQFEYAWVESAVYTEKRNVVLKHFFDMQPLYQTTYFQDLLEFNAKKNLSVHIQIENLSSIQTFAQFRTQSANKKFTRKKSYIAEFIDCLNEMSLYLLLGIVLASITALISNRLMVLFVCTVLIIIGCISFKRKPKQATLELNESKSKTFVHTNTLLNYVKDYERLRVPLLFYAIYLIDKFSCDSLREAAIVITHKMDNKEFDLKMMDANLMEKIGEAYSEHNPNTTKIAQILSDLLNYQSIDSENIQLIMQNISEIFYSLSDNEITFEDKHLHDLILLKS